MRKEDLMYFTDDEFGRMARLLREAYRADVVYEEDAGIFMELLKALDDRKCICCEEKPE